MAKSGFRPDAFIISSLTVGKLIEYRQKINYS